MIPPAATNGGMEAEGPPGSLKPAVDKEQNRSPTKVKQASRQGQENQPMLTVCNKSSFPRLPRGFRETHGDSQRPTRLQCALRGLPFSRGAGGAASYIGLQDRKQTNVYVVFKNQLGVQGSIRL